MPTIGFSGGWTGKKTIPEQRQAVFDLIRSGEKSQTIRKPWKSPILPGEILHLFWHMRRKDCERIGQAVCISVERIQINPQRETVHYESKVKADFFILMDEQTLAKLIYRDGFKNLKDFWAYFQCGEYDIIRWELQNGKH